MGNFLVSSLLTVTLFLIPILSYIQPNSTSVELASHAISLENRQPDSWVNQIFQDNILLTVAYARGSVKDSSNIPWEEVERPFTYTFTLEPGEIFAFHDDVLPQYKGKISKTTNAHFNFQDGFKSDGYLFGDGVCHLASLMYWTSRDAGLSAYAPVRHDFAPIADITPEYGVSIFDQRGDSSGAMQNLYITNNKVYPVYLRFDYKDTILKFSISEDNTSTE